MSGSFGQTNDGKEPERNLQPAAAARRFKTKATEKNKQRRPTKTTTISCFVNLCHFWPLTLSERELNANIVALDGMKKLFSNILNLYETHNARDMAENDGGKVDWNSSPPIDTIIRTTKFAIWKRIKTVSIMIHTN